MQVTTTRAAAAAAPTAASTTPTTPAPSQPATTLDYSAFLRLLIAEMKNQDPTKPMDSAQYVGQLAAFSNVEQAVKMNAKLDSMMAAFALTQAEGFIGRTITTPDGNITGKVVSVRVTSDGAVATLDGGQQVLLGPGITVT